MARREHPDEIDSRSASYLAFMADLETGWLEREPHELSQIGPTDEHGPHGLGRGTVTGGAMPYSASTRGSDCATRRLAMNGQWMQRSRQEICQKDAVRSQGARAELHAELSVYSEAIPRQPAERCSQDHAAE